MTYVCVTGNEQSPASLEQRLERVLSAHPRVLCELRLDFLDQTPAAAFGFLARLPAEMAPRLVLTQRLKASGAVANGQCSWDILTWQSWWRDVMALRPWFAVDLDWIVLDRLAGDALEWRGKFRTRHAFFSLHGNLKEVEAALPAMLATAREQDAGVKIACPVEGARDLARLSAMSRELKELPFHAVSAMGLAGRPWRWSRLAGTLTYFAAESARITAPGQEPLSAVLPYLSTKQRPDLFLLLGDNPDNRYGEQRWNRAFLHRGARQRYVNCPSVDEPGAIWAENSLKWMTEASVKGASVTKPYKVSFPSPTNTLKWNSGSWERANTDGEAVALLLARHGVGAGKTVVVAGGGGAALAVEAGLAEAGLKPKLWVREDGRLGTCPEGDALVATWPGPYQENLVQALPDKPGFSLVIDAQLSRTEAESPLAAWCRDKNISYLSGGAWWKEQARLQDYIWFGEDRLEAAKDAALALVPSSKSETIRALAICTACGVSGEVRGAADNEDVTAFLRALEAVGVSVHQEGTTLVIYPPRDLAAPAEPVFLGEGATGLRILGALSVLMKKGPLRLTGTDRLQERPSDELRHTLGAGAGWPLEIPTGRDLPDRLSAARSSQFVTGFLLAGAGAVYRGHRSEYLLELEGEARSLPYIHLTLSMLDEAGFVSEWNQNTIRLSLREKKKQFHFSVEKDASSLAFPEVYARRWRLSSFFGPSRQGDAAFPEFLRRMELGEAISLRHHPDLAPPLWAAAVLSRSQLKVVDCPQLHWKESDRAKLLVKAALDLGVTGEEASDGFTVDFRSYVPPQKEIFLRTDGDHRLAMAFALLGTEDAKVAPDRKDCVRKSFPRFWEMLTLLEEALPG